MPMTCVCACQGSFVYIQVFFLLRRYRALLRRYRAVLRMLFDNASSRSSLAKETVTNHWTWTYAREGLRTRRREEGGGKRGKESTSERMSERESEGEGEDEGKGERGRERERVRDRAKEMERGRVREREREREQASEMERASVRERERKITSVVLRGGSKTQRVRGERER